MMLQRGNLKGYSAVDGQWGEIGERQVQAFLELLGFTVHPYPLGRYGPDLLLIGHSGSVYVEVERRRRNWECGPFPFSTIHIQERRIRKALDGQSVFVQISAAMDEGLVIWPSSALEHAVLKEVSNCSVSGELMAEIPTTEATRLKLWLLDWL